MGSLGKWMNRWTSRKEMKGCVGFPVLSRKFRKRTAFSSHSFNFFQIGICHSLQKRKWEKFCIYKEILHSQVFLFPRNVNHPMISTTPEAWHPGVPGFVAELSSEYQFLAKTWALQLPCCSGFWSSIWVSAPNFPQERLVWIFFNWNLQFTSLENWSHLSNVAEIGKGFWDYEEKGQWQTSNILLTSVLSTQKIKPRSICSLSTITHLPTKNLLCSGFLEINGDKKETIILL